MAEINKSYEKMPGLGRALGGSHQRFRPHQKPRNTKGTIRRLLTMLLQWRGTMLAAVLLTTLSSAVSITLPLLIGRAVNTFNIAAGTVDTAGLTTILLVIAACYLTAWATDTTNGVVMAKVTQKLVKAIRTQLFAKLQKIPLGFFDTRAHGDTMSRLTNDVDNISQTVSQATTQLVSSCLTITGTLVIMLTLSPVMTCVALVSIPLFLLLTRTISKRSSGLFLEQQRKLGALGGIIEENIVGLKMVKAFNRQKNVTAEFARVNAELRSCSAKAQTWAGFLMPFMNVINNLSFGLIATAGGVLSVRGMLSVGLVVSFLTYSRQFGMPLNSIAGMFANIQSALAGAERVFELLDEAEEAADREDVREITDVKGKVEFKDVTFSYIPGSPVLKDVSFTVNPGEVVALVGETGAGKTTIVNLLTRFYELDGGRILIDDTDILDISRETLRGCFSVVLQETFLFTGTIADNIRYSRPTATDEEVRAAAGLAHADDFISRLPGGYETIVTGSADNLSLGQRQLIAIARAILAEAPILILDEATSSVDTKTEKEIQQALLTLMKSHTSFLIAHRLSTIRDADRIMVIGGGEILESGTHNALMANKGAYYEMVMSQLGMGGGIGA
ncbi:ATP-binding cassette, subfamily B [Sporobacter termitidis DSM 10068]|uniref:ATP-binding cassette, subfamily B n=1 Tax=Sporobacter termitidis DSM 10068 TaxID=1123282 RepID=A0A1M5YCY1_9FIRM|nr:ABC transporter ATP-binding protein [Sporobacter termitidis]SHI09920.1 ATP-binding cassette, subfamily B [Sporobacter termitidis DSM 10068]